MGDLLSLKGVRFAYRGGRGPALDGVDLSVGPGEFVGVMGATGAGKSTLLRAAAGIVPHFYRGAFQGEVALDGASIAGRKVADLAGAVGTLFQDFESQLFSTNVRLECAFGMENLGLPRIEMKARIERVAALVGLSGLMDREPQSLSGGQKQRLALASILCLEPRLLLCDEPTTDLDPAGREEVFDVLTNLSRSGRAIVLIDHETDRLLGADRLLILDRGRTAALGRPCEVLADPDCCRGYGIRPPDLFVLFHKLGLSYRPASVREAAGLLDREGFSFRPAAAHPDLPEPGGEPLIRVENLEFAYTPGRPALRRVSLDIRRGDFVAILGQNGSGKTTLVKHLSALLPGQSGRVLYEGDAVDRFGPAGMARRVGFVFQNPDHMLFAANVFEEVAFGLKNLRPGEDPGPRVSQALETVGLAGMETLDPFVLPKGERQKLAVACVVALEPEALILDEPTTGLDAREQEAMMGLLTRLNRAGHTIIIVTHTMSAVVSYARRVVLMEGGRIIADGPTREVFHRPDLLARASLVAPPCVRLSALVGGRALTVDELAGELTRGAR
jgi:energy-coupling factor transport system ATP-binding protein